MVVLSGAWLRRKVRHPWLGGPRRLTMYLATLDCAISNPSLSSSPANSKRIFDAHPPDQLAQFRVDLRSSSQWARLPTPVGAAKTCRAPLHRRLGPDDRENLQDRWKPATQLDQEPAIMVGEPDATLRPAPQDNQLVSKHRVLASSRNFDLNGEARTARTKSNRSSPIIPPAQAIHVITLGWCPVHSSLTACGPTAVTSRPPRSSAYCALEAGQTELASPEDQGKTGSALAEAGFKDLASRNWLGFEGFRTFAIRLMMAI